MAKTSVYLDSEVLAALRRAAESQGRSQAELIREAVRIYVRMAEHPKLPGIGEFDSGYTNTSTSLNRILRQAVRTGRLR
jgi:metal-responsive CopG/Arc/MetJ family transcriptional regulator